MHTPHEVRDLLFATRERTDVDEVPAHLALGRALGEDVAGEPVLKAGTTLGPAHLGMLAARGRRTIPTYGPAGVAVVVVDAAISGNEDPEDLPTSPAAAAVLAAVGRSEQIPIDMGTVPASAELHHAALARALQMAEIVCTIGAGPADAEAVRAQFGGRLPVHGVSQTPGESFAYAVLPEGVWFGLPAAPAAALLCFELYVRPYALRLAGHAAFDLPVVRGAFDAAVVCTDAHQWVWGRIDRSNDGARLESLTDDQAGDLAAAARADGLILLAPKIACREDATAAAIYLVR